MADLLDAYKWEANLGGLAAERSAVRIGELVEDSRAAGITPVMDRSGSPLHFGEPHLGSVDVVELKAGEGGNSPIGSSQE